MEQALTGGVRGMAALIALLAAVALLAQGWVTARTLGTADIAEVIWFLAAYFTILTNLIVALSFGLMSLRGRWPGPAWLTGVTLWIATVGVVYHLLLAALVDLTGAGWWTDQALHTVVPGLVVLFWLLFAPKRGLRPVHAGLWLIYPAIYCTYAVTRGMMTGFWSYPFINVDNLGAIIVARNVAMLVVAFLVAGLVLLLIARVMERRVRLA